MTLYEKYLELLDEYVRLFPNVPAREADLNVLFAVDRATFYNAQNAGFEVSEDDERFIEWLKGRLK